MNIEEYKETLKKSKGSKYKNKKTEYNGVIYDSAGEAKWAQFLDTCTKVKDPKDRVVNINRQIPYRFFINEKLIFTYIADFVVLYGDKRIEIQDYKGMRTDIYRLKKKLIEAHHGIKIIEITKADLPK